MRTQNTQGRRQSRAVYRSGMWEQLRGQGRLEKLRTESRGLDCHQGRGGQEPTIVADAQC